MPNEVTTMEKIVALCKRRGFIFQSSEIYGGIGGFWDYGPLGSQLKKNIKDAWWNDMVLHPPVGPDGKDLQMVGVDCSIIMNPKVWEASGHTGGFQDKMVACKTEGCKRLFRADKLWSAQIAPPECFGEGVAEELETKGRSKAASWLPTPERMTRVRGVSLEADGFADAVSAFQNIVQKVGKKRNDGLLKGFQLRPIPDFAYLIAFEPLLAGQDAKGTLYACRFSNYAGKCPVCDGELTEPREFNLMLDTYPGAVRDEANKTYLRPETAQGIFVNFKNVCDSTRVKIPFGIAQMGKAFRNEINPRNYTFRSREFEQMEIEFFCHDRDAMMWWEWWRDVRINWYKSLGLAGERLRPRNQEGDELAHYSKACTDIEYLFPFSDEPQELEGVAHRGCYDLTQHQKHSGKDLSYFDDETRERYVPTVIEPSAGADRSTLAFITEAYSVDENRASPELLKFHPRLAPIKAAVFPLVAKDGMPEIAEPIYRELRKRLVVQYDPKQSIGKRYARMDEAGTPFCFTIDGQSKEDGTVTVRNRDDASQVRIPKEGCLKYLSEKLDL